MVRHLDWETLIDHETKRSRIASRKRKETTMQANQAQQTPQTVNGLDTVRMTETVEAIRATPSLGRFEFRARNQWIDGGANRSTIKDFYGAGQEDASREQPFVFMNGEPPVLLGANEGANPVEFLLHALAGCVTTTTVLHAAARGIHIRSLSTELSGNIDVQGLLDLDPSVPVGYDQIHIKMHIEADCSDEELDDLLAFVHGHSPVCNTVCRPVPVVIERVGRPEA
jgi:uncharacterized OsmC-like protein